MIKKLVGLIGLINVLNNVFMKSFNLSLSRYWMILFLFNPSWAYALSDACQSLYPSNFSLIQGQHTAETPSISKPAKGIHYLDPKYGTCVVRATDHINEPPSGFARNDYSRRQAFNADNSHFLVYSYDGFWHLYNADSLSHIKKLENGPAGDAEPQWHPTEPHLFYYIPTNGGMVVYEYNINHDNTRVVGNFSERLPWSDAACVWTKAEGSPSADGRYWGFMVQKDNFDGLGLMVWDMETDTIEGTWDFAANGVGKPDHVSMSPSGEYMVASWDGNQLGTTAFNHDFSQQLQLHHKSEHSDIALLPNGHDAYVSIDYQDNEGSVFMVELQTGIKTDLFDSYVNGTATALHISGKSYNKPGWVLVSTYGTYLGDGHVQWLHSKIFALELKENPKIFHIAHHHSGDDDYFTEPHAVVNKDFTKILFNSNWGHGNGLNVDTYMVELPVDALVSSSTDPEPNISLVSGGGSYPAGTTEVELVIQTDVDASCRIEDVPNIVYGQMDNNFSSADGIHHSVTLNTDTSGDFNYYARCLASDTGSENSQDFHIQFTVDVPLPSDGTPQITLVSSQWYPQGTDEVTIVISTNVAADCRLATVPNIPFDVMYLNFEISEGLNHSHTISTYGGGDFDYYARCRASSTAAVNDSDFPILFRVATDPNEGKWPVVTIVSGDGVYPAGTQSVELVVATDVAADCRLSEVSNTSYESMDINFNSVDYFNHSRVVNPPGSGSFVYYMRCQNRLSQQSNSNDLAISIEVETPTDQPPTRTIVSGTGLHPYDTTEVDIVIQTDMEAECRFAMNPIADVPYDALYLDFISTDHLSHHYTITTWNGHNYTYYAKCRGLINQVENSTDLPLSVQVPTSLPPQLTLSTVNVNLQTDVVSTCRLAVEEGVPYSNMTINFNSDDGLGHDYLASIHNGNTDYYIKCQDVMTGSSNPKDFKVNISHESLP